MLSFAQALEQFLREQPQGTTLELAQYFGRLRLEGTLSAEAEAELQRRTGQAVDPMSSPAEPERQPDAFERFLVKLCRHVLERLEDRERALCVLSRLLAD